MATTQVTVYFGYVAGNFLTLDDPVKGEINDSTYPLITEYGEDITSSGFVAEIRRGRNRELDDFEAGTASVHLRNYTRTFDGTYTSGSHYGNLVPGKRATIARYGVTLFDGLIEDWNVTYTVEGEADAEFVAGDALSQLGRKDFDAWNTTASQTAGPRLSDVLDRNEVAFGANRALDDGVSILQSDLVTWGSNVLNYGQLVAKSDGGRLYADRMNVLTFTDRHGLFGATAAVTFRSDGTETSFHGATLDAGPELLYNRVGVDREGGTLQTVEDQDSMDAYGGVRNLSIPGLLMNTDAQSLDMATYLLNLYKTPFTRVSSITVKVHGLPASQQATVAALDIGDLVRIVWTPRSTGNAIDQYLVVEGVDHSISLVEHTMVVHTSQQTQQSVFRLDDAIYGVLNANLLAF